MYGKEPTTVLWLFSQKGLLIHRPLSLAFNINRKTNTKSTKGTGNVQGHFCSNGTRQNRVGI